MAATTTSSSTTINTTSSSTITTTTATTVCSNGPRQLISAHSTRKDSPQLAAPGHADVQAAAAAHPKRMAAVE